MRLDVPLAVLTPHRNNQLKLLGLGFTSAPRQSQSFALEEPLEPGSFAFPTTGGCTGFDQSARFAVFAAVQQQLGLKPELDAAAMEGRLERMRAARGGLGGARQRPALASCGLGSLSAVPATFECGPQGPPRMPAPASTRTGWDGTPCRGMSDASSEVPPPPRTGPASA
jgi:hypothetical protein